MNKKKTLRRKSRDIDWENVYRQMGTATEAINKGGLLLPDEKKAILKARAINLAQENFNENKVNGETIDVLEFFLSDEIYCVETFFVREVFSLKELTSLPGTPTFVIGITNVRGEIVSVIDIKNFLGMPEAEPINRSKIIIIQDNEMEFGILADEISSVRSIPLNLIQQTLPTLTGVISEYIKGVTNDHTVLIDTAKILSDKKIAVGKYV